MAVTHAARVFKTALNLAHAEDWRGNFGPTARHRLRAHGDFLPTPDALTYSDWTYFQAELEKLATARCNAGTIVTADEAQNIVATVGRDVYGLLVEWKGEAISLRPASWEWPWANTVVIQQILARQEAAAARHYELVN